jgi:hypothetical protein
MEWWGEAPERPKHFRKASSGSAALRFATPIQAPSRALDVPLPDCRGLRVCMLDGAGRPAARHRIRGRGACWARLGARVGIANERAPEAESLRDSAQVFQERRPTNQHPHYSSTPLLQRSFTPTLRRSAGPFRRRPSDNRV